MPKTEVKARRVGIEAQPVGRVQWVERDALHANDYNPNKVAKPELTLLALSILEDGWTQPIVARSDGEIVDGFHRWSVSEFPAVFAMTDGAVPVVFLPDDMPLEHQVASTIRHNRARGVHGVIPMANIVRQLLDKHGLSREEVMAMLGMEWEEVDRLYDRGEMVKRGAGEDFGNGWVPGA